MTLLSSFRDNEMRGTSVPLDGLAPLEVWAGSQEFCSSESPNVEVSLHYI